MESKIQPFLIYTKGKMRGIMNAQKKLIVPCIHEDLNITSIRGGLIYCEQWLKANDFSYTNLVFTEEGATVDPLYPPNPYLFERMAEHIPLFGAVGGAWGFMRGEKEPIFLHVYRNLQYCEGGYVLVRAKNNKWGCIDLAGKVHLLPSYESIQCTEKGFFVVKRGRKMRLMHPQTQKGDWIYDKIEFLKPLWKGLRNGKWILLDAAGEMIDGVEYQDITLLYSGYLRAVQGNRHGLLNASTGQVVLPLEQEIGSFSYFRGEQILKIQDGKWGVMNAAQQYVVPCAFDKIEDWGSLVLVLKANLKGCWNDLGQCLLRCEFDELRHFTNCIAAQQNNLWGFWDLSGQCLFPCQFDSILPFDALGAGVRQAHKWGFINASGQLSFPCTCDAIAHFHQNVLKIQQEHRWGLIGLDGTPITTCKYKEIQNLYEGRAVVSRGRHLDYYGYLNEAGEEVIPMIYENAYRFQDGLAKVCYGNEGFIDKDGNIVIPFIYDKNYLGDFHHGFAAAGLRGENDGIRMGAIDKQNQMVIPFLYDMVYPFQEGGYTWAEIGEDDFVIDRTGYVYYEPA